MYVLRHTGCYASVPPVATTLLIAQALLQSPSQVCRLLPGKVDIMLFFPLWEAQHTRYVCYSGTLKLP